MLNQTSKELYSSALQITDYTALYCKPKQKTKLYFKKSSHVCAYH